MELPKNIKDLYRHWDFHLEKNTVTTEENTIIPDALASFIRERISIWQKKVSGFPSPYTSDPILAQYRFCNIFREFDKQTIVFHTLLNPLREDFPLWLMNMFMARMIARPETLDIIGLLSFETAKNTLWKTHLEALPSPKYGVPYVFPISVIQRTKTPDRESFLGEYVPNHIQKVASEILSWNKVSVRDGLARILPLFGVNLAFLWTEVLIDVAYQFPNHIDLFGAFPIGPGSAPTIKKIAPPNAIYEKFVATLATIPFYTDIEIDGIPLRLSAENWEGIGCEFRKYSHLQEGKGRKRLYTS